jgi:hypothetical protein
MDWPENIMVIRMSDVPRGPNCWEHYIEEVNRVLVEACSVPEEMRGGCCGDQ